MAMVVLVLGTKSSRLFRERRGPRDESEYTISHKFTISLYLLLFKQEYYFFNTSPTTIRISTLSLARSAYKDLTRTIDLYSEKNEKIIIIVELMNLQRLGTETKLLKLIS